MERNKILELLKDQEYHKKIISFLETQKKQLTSENKLNLLEESFLKKFEKDLITALILEEFFSEESRYKIKSEFGEKIHDLLLEQKKLGQMIQKSKNEKVELIREAILSLAQNPGAITLELILKIIHVKKNPTKKEEAKKIMNLYVPLAERLGLKKIKKELAEECFKIINPKKHREIENFLKMSQKEREEHIKEITKKMGDELKRQVKEIKIKGREKQIYSIYEKITKRKVPLDKQKDHFAIRIITKTEEECYKVLDCLNKNYNILTETFKDYIKNPKPNGYQSIHFCIKLNNKLIETQIRTTKMDEFAEEGGAAHWTYKQIKGSKKFEKKAAWFKEVLKLNDDKKIPLNEMNINLFQDKTYCLTPKGKIICLKKDSTVLDFAYKIHAEIGNHSIGGVVDGKFVSLRTPLKNGETVEIITNKFQRPRREWLKFIKTRDAKKVISQEVRKYEKIPVPRTKSLKEKNKIEIETPAVIPEFPNHTLIFAKCCNPLPGNELIGTLRSYKKAIIHKKECDKIKESKKHQIKAQWKEKHKNPIKIIIEGEERSGILADIINTISRKGFNIKEANAKLIGNGLAECSFLISLGTLENLKEVIKRIKRIRGISKIYLE
jgi:(p)ppGpp synthase/HD superfamily hydrolase